MFKLKQSQIFMICETILFLFVAYSVFTYIRSINTKLNKVSNRLNMLETFIQQSNLSINSAQLIKESVETPQKNVSFDIADSKESQEQKLLEMIEKSYKELSMDTLDVEENNLLNRQVDPIIMLTPPLDNYNKVVEEEENVVEEEENVVEEEENVVEEEEDEEEDNNDLLVNIEDVNEYD